jgi:integrase
MTLKSEAKAPHGGPTAPVQPNLNDVLVTLKGHKGLSPSRVRDLCSSVKRTAKLVGDEPARIPLDLPAISAKLAATSPAASGLTGKTFSNIRSNFLAAIKASGLKPVQRLAKASLSAAWQRLMAELSARRAHIGLSRFARYASSMGIEPAEVDDATLEGFIIAVRSGTLHRKPNGLHRTVALIWNEVAQISRLPLQRVTVQSFRQPAKRVDWSLLPDSFRNDLKAYLDWSGGTDSFAADARSRALAVQTVKSHQNYVHAAVTALVESGISPSAITSLSELVTVDNFKRILRRRHQMVDGRENAFNRDLARTLVVEIARRWVKVDAAVLEELKRLASKVPVPLAGLTSKNKEVLRQFDHPANLRRLLEFPDRLWAEVKRDRTPDGRTLVKAQAALAVGILSYMPVRPQNLWALKFDENIFLHEGPGAISSLELPAAEVKNRTELAFDIPPHLAKMLLEYRNRLAPKVIGRRPDRLFVKADGTAKTQWAVAWLIRTYLKRRAGLQLSPHQFRHLAARLLLDAEPGNFETARQLLGHKSLRTTVQSYTGISSRRAARHHYDLLQQALAAQQPTRGAMKGLARGSRRRAK